METCGQVDAKVFRKAVEEFDLFLFDVKTLDQEKMDRFVGGSVTMILDNLSFLAERHQEKALMREQLTGFQALGQSLGLHVGL